MVNVNIYKRHFYILYFPWGTICANKSNRQTDTETDKLIAIREILQICLKNVNRYRSQNVQEDMQVVWYAPDHTC